MQFPILKCRFRGRRHKYFYAILTACVILWNMSILLGDSDVSLTALIPMCKTIQLFIISRLENSSHLETTQRGISRSTTLSKPWPWKMMKRITSTPRCSRATRTGDCGTSWWKPAGPQAPTQVTRICLFEYCISFLSND